MKWISRVVLFILLFFSNFKLVRSYVHNIDTLGNKKVWDNKDLSLTIFSNGNNSSGFSTSSFQTLVNSSVAQWNNHSGASITNFETSNNLRDNQNNIAFSDDALFFSSSSVLAVTITYTNSTSSRILESDILINDTLSYSSSPGGTRYLGDILTHELGHFLGLDHSSTKGSSMLYVLFDGQDSTHTDDHAGVYALYPVNNKASISGNIVGGASSAVRIFGAHVQAISQGSGKVIASAISDENGYFKIDGLDSSDQYFLYIEELGNISAVSNYYSTIKNNFCTSNSSYRGSFYQSCRSRESGYPQAINVSSNTNIDIGNVTIRCSLNVPQGYLTAQDTTDFDLDIYDSGSETFGNTFTGFFTNENIGKDDRIRIDLSDYDFSTNFSSEDLYLEFKLTSQSYYSKLKYSLEVSSGQGTYNFPSSINAEGVQFDSEGNPSLEIFDRVEIDELNQVNNNFLFTLTSENFDNFISSLVVTPVSSEDYFPASADYIDNQLFYLLVVNVVKKNTDGSYTVVNPKQYSIQANDQCLDAPRSINVQANKTIVTSTLLDSGRKNKADEAIACGSVNLGDGSGGGPGNVLIGMLLSSIIFILASTKKRLNRYV